MFTAVAPSLGLGAGPAVTDRRTPLASRARCRSRAPCSSRGRPVIVLAVSTNTNSNTNADTTVSTITSSSARGHFIVSETKAGVTQYSFAGPPFSHTEGEEGIRDEGERAAAFAGHPHVKKEVMFDVVLDCRGGVHVTGLVFVQGPDGLLQVSKIHPGGSAVGQLAPGDVLLGCSAVVMVEDDAGNFVRAPRWHDAAAPGTAAEHTLGVIMTHGDGGADTEGGLRVRACRGYVPRLDKRIRGAWSTLVPTTASRDVRETWARLFYCADQEQGVSKAEEVQEYEGEVGIGAVWSTLMPRRPSVRENVRASWAAISLGLEQAAAAAAAAAPEQGSNTEEQADELYDAAAASVSVVEEIQAAAAAAVVAAPALMVAKEEGGSGTEDPPAAAEPTPATAGASRNLRRQSWKDEMAREMDKLSAAVAELEEPELQPDQKKQEGVAAAAAAAVEPAPIAAAQASVSAPPPARIDEGQEGNEEEQESATFTALEVTLDCSQGVNMTGLRFDQRPDGLLRVSVCRQSGTARKKVKVGDVLLATTYVTMVPDPTGERSRGVPLLEWLDATGGASFDELQMAMMTHDFEMKLKLGRGEVPMGYFSPGRAAAAKTAKTAKSANTSREDSARSAPRTPTSNNSVSAVPVDVMNWAAKIAAEARAKR